MFLTILSYLGNNNRDADGSEAGSHMSSENYRRDAEFEEEWEQVRLPIPISEDEDYEIVVPPSQTFTQNYRDPSARVASTSSGILQRVREWHSQRSIQRNQLDESFSKTFAKWSSENPDQMEEHSIQRAMELSMLDVALVQHCDPSESHIQRQQTASPHSILGVAKNANPSEIKTAYRQLARLHHPDKGGESRRFEEIARAYRSLLSSTVLDAQTPGIDNTSPQSDYYDEPKTQMHLTTAMCDKGLQDHRRLVNDLFRADGMDLQSCIEKQLTALDMLGLSFQDAGATNRNERNEIIHNSCFYLGLATSYLWGIGALSVQHNGRNMHMHEDSSTLEGSEEENLLVGDTALQLKRTIEAAVVRAHPEWVLQGKVGEEVQAFSDFLVYTLDSQTLLSEWAIVVFDATSGFCDIYKGRNYDNKKSTLQSNTVTLRYIPGHYQPLIPANSLSPRPTLSNILTALDDLGVFYAVTDGN